MAIIYARTVSDWVVSLVHDGRALGVYKALVEALGVYMV